MTSFFLANDRVRIELVQFVAVHLYWSSKIRSLIAL